MNQVHDGRVSAADPYVWVFGGESESDDDEADASYRDEEDDDDDNEDSSSDDSLKEVPFWPPLFPNPAAAARAWPGEPVASLPRADPWPIHGDNKTSRELWALDSAVARRYLIRVAEGLAKSISVC